MGLIRKNKPKPVEADTQLLPSFEIKPTMYSANEAQGVLIASRQLPGYPTAIGLFGAALSCRADRILIDYAANAVAVRFRVDGVWEANPPMDRPTGDAALVVIKKIMGMDPNERRLRQLGKCTLATQTIAWLTECTSAAVASGERVLVNFEPKKPLLKSLEELGMREAMREQFRAALNAHGGLMIISAPAGHGLPTTWRVGLEAADRFVRDWISLEDGEHPDGEIINVTQHLIKSAEGETPEQRLYQVMLKQPDVFVLPSLYNDDVVEKILEQVKTQDKHAVTKTVANDAVEAIIAVLSTHRKKAKELLLSISAVSNQRLMRRLCQTCRQPFTPSPQMLQKLGIPPGRVSQLYQPFVLPPPDKRIDAEGKPILPCPTCSGRGYYGQFAIFELLTVDDEVRKSVLQNAKNPAAIRQFLKTKGHLSLQEEGVLAVALGQTSLQELQRVFSGK